LHDLQLLDQNRFALACQQQADRAGVLQGELSVCSILAIESKALHKKRTAAKQHCVCVSHAACLLASGCSASVHASRTLLRLCRWRFALQLHLLLSATQSADGNATTLCAPLFATQFANAPNVKCNANRLHVPNAKFTAKSHNAVFVAPKTCAKRMTAPSARLCALQLNATHNASPQIQFARPFVKIPSAIGSARNQLCAPSQSVSYNARSLLVKHLRIHLFPLATMVAARATKPESHKPLRRPAVLL